jgi:prepilin peptidase CpaA
MAGWYHIGLWALLITAAICDLIWGKVFNWVNGLFLLGGLFTQFYFGGMTAFSQSLLAIAVAFLFFFPLYLAKAFAAGDVKLLMAIGAWADPRTVIELGAVAIVFGSLIGLFLLLKKSGVRESLKSMRMHLKITLTTKGYRIPFAPAFLSAFLLIQIWEKYR